MIQDNPELSLKVANEILAKCQAVKDIWSSVPVQILLDRMMFQTDPIVSDTPDVESKIRNILADWVHGYPLEQLQGFLSFIYSQ